MNSASIRETFLHDETAHNCQQEDVLKCLIFSLSKYSILGFMPTSPNFSFTGATKSAMATNPSVQGADFSFPKAGKNDGLKSPTPTFQTIRTTQQKTGVTGISSSKLDGGSAPNFGLSGSAKPKVPQGAAINPNNPPSPHNNTSTV